MPSILSQLNKIPLREARDKGNDALHPNETEKKLLAFPLFSDKELFVQVVSVSVARGYSYKNKNMFVSKSSCRFVRS